jgi:hypothetical protein
VRDFFASRLQAGRSILIALNGKTLRGTIPAGQTQGLHFLRTFLPGEGWVNMQVAVGEQRERDESSAAHGQMPGLTGQNRDWGCAVGATGFIRSDRGRRRRLCLDGLRQPKVLG